MGLWGINKRLANAEKERDTYRDALVRARNILAGQVCSKFEICNHPWCNANYMAYEIIDKAIREIDGEDEFDVF